ncbi:putative cytochrome P450 [Daldinia sp. FL1419]|nr:putative cytochrome P450 [Daldinia sp. FL1419]
MLVTPGRSWLYLGHPDIVKDVVRSRDDFPRCVELTEVLDVFGPNVGTPKASDMIRHWADRPSVRSTANDRRTLSLDLSYKDSLKLILEHCILIIVMGPKLFTNTLWLPRKYRQLGEAVTAFQSFMTDMYESEKGKVDQGISGTTSSRTFLSSLAKASPDAKPGEDLTEREIYGNIFVINFASHDTSAHASTFTIYFLVVNPAVQDWLSEELHAVLGHTPSQEWDFTTGFPRLKCCLAVLYETIRLYTPIQIIKWMKEKTQTLNVGDKAIALPLNTMMSKTKRTPQGEGRGVKEEEFVDAAHSLVGPKVVATVPGEVSQVEFVATMAPLFCEWRVDPANFEGETFEAARDQVLDLIKNDSSMVLLQQMLHPERAPLAWSKR